MFIDANELQDEALLRERSVVVGGGAAGITLAATYLGRSETITLIESGGLEYKAETQALYKGRNVGWEYFDFDISRLRYWGGSINHWSARCRPLNAIADDPRRGVVDRNQRVHGMDNLYIAGSSVFPTSGSANPTLTIVAMTLRLAEMLQQSGPAAAAPCHAGRAAP